MSRARRSAGLTSVDGSCCFLTGTVCGNFTRSAPAPPSCAGRLAKASGAPPSWASAPACGTTNSNMFVRWNGSIPLARRRRTASKSDVGASSYFCAKRRAIRNCRPVRPSWRIASMVFSLATCWGEATLSAGASCDFNCGAGCDFCSELTDSSAGAPPIFGVDRLMRNFLAFGFVVIQLFRFLEGVEHM